MNGKLLEVLPSYDALVAVRVASYLEEWIVGVITQPGWVIEPALPHAAAPAACGTSSTDAIANPEPAISRRAHMVHALLPQRRSLCVPELLPADLSAGRSLLDPSCLVTGGIRNSTACPSWPAAPLVGEHARNVAVPSIRHRGQRTGRNRGSGGTGKVRTGRVVIGQAEATGL
ncbi:MAG: hypothetical protein ACLQPH_11105 [Acidimicrobiales bacterium]